MKIINDEKLWKELNYETFENYLDDFKEWSKAYATHLIENLTYTAQILQIPALTVNGVDLGAVTFVRALSDTPLYEDVKGMLKAGETERIVNLKFYEHHIIT